MPKLNGHEVCRASVSSPGAGSIRIIAQTGWGQDADRLRSSEAGFDDHLVKPVDPEELDSLLRV